ncbi:hypothetical protein C1645_746207, partial [Glomus cerebriforme]
VYILTHYIISKAFHSKIYNFNIPDNIDDFNKQNNQNSSASKAIQIFKDNSERLLKVFKKLQTSSMSSILVDIQNNYKMEIKKDDNNVDEDEVYNNPNLHTEEQDQLEIPDIFNC